MERGSPGGVPCCWRPGDRGASGYSTSRPRLASADCVREAKRCERLGSTPPHQPTLRRTQGSLRPSLALNLRSPVSGLTCTPDHALPPCTPSLPLGYAAMRSSFGSARPTPPYRRLIAVPEMLSQAVSSTLNVLLLATSNSAQSDASTAICAEHRALSHELEHFLRRPSLAQTSLHRS